MLDHLHTCTQQYHHIYKSISPIERYNLAIPYCLRRREGNKENSYLCSLFMLEVAIEYGIEHKNPTKN
jgi:hypothetical protein